MEIQKYEFTQTILGSNNGFDVKKYDKGEIIAKQDLSEELFTAWAKREVLKPVKNDVIEEEEKEEVTEENKELLIEDLKALLQVEENIDTDELKRIGMILGIKNIAKTVNPDTIIKKVKQYLEEL